MDLSLISQLLKRIIMQNGKVSLPMMGSLEVEDVPAGFSPDGSVIAPPYRKIVFNSFDVDNDGLLEDEYSSAKGITLEEGRKEVAEFVNSVKTSLIDNKAFSIDGLGKIIFGDDFKYNFETAGSLNLSPDSFGLDSFKVEKIDSRSGDGAKQESKDHGDAVNILGSTEKSVSGTIEDFGAPEHSPEFAKVEQPPIDYEFNNESEAKDEDAIDEEKTIAREISSVADVYKIAPAAIAPAAKRVDDTIKGTVIVDSGHSDDVADSVENEEPHPIKKEAEVLHFTKKQNPVESDNSAERTDKFIPSAGVLGGHSYVFGKPLQSEATEVVVLGDNGKYEVEHKAVEIEDEESEKKSGAAKAGGVEDAQSAVGAIGLNAKAGDVNNVEVNVVTKSGAASAEEAASDEELSPEEIELKKRLEAQQIAESEKKAEQKLWQDAQKVQQQKEQEEAARAEAERIEKEKHAAEEIAERRRRGELIEDEKQEIGLDGKPRAKVVKDIEGQDESAKESIAEIFTTVAEKEANASKAKVVGEKEASKDWSAVKNSAAEGETESAEDAVEREKKRAEELAKAEEEKAKAKAKADAWAKRQKEEEQQLQAERKLRNAKILKYLKYFGYGVAAVVVLALVVYALREPLKPVLEHLLYNADELRVIHYNL
jgi:hypothetical protein